MTKVPQSPATPLPYRPEIDGLRGLAALAERVGAIYLSSTAVLCNDEGCLTRLGETVESLTAKDDTHLTETSSRFLVS